MKRTFFSVFHQILVTILYSRYLHFLKIEMKDSLNKYFDKIIFKINYNYWEYNFDIYEYM